MLPAVPAPPAPEGSILLSPHNDDEALFAAYTLLRHKPHVVVCFAPRRARHLAQYERRAAESAAAMAVLGCPVASLGYPIPNTPDAWAYFEQLLGTYYDPPHVWAPLPEVGGHPDHNGLGEAALRLWPGRVTLYTTYTMVRDDAGGVAGSQRSTSGTPVVAEPGWPELKAEALACYETQREYAGTRVHFERPLDEYEVQP